MFGMNIPDPVYGRRSYEEGSDVQRQQWRHAIEQNADPQVHHLTGEWVPISAISIRDGITPREQRLNSEVAETYKLQLDELPPIVVQRDSFALIDGYHRFMAAFEALRWTIRVIEVDCPDDDLWILAYEANTRHGLPMKPSERLRAGRRYWERFKDEKSDTEIAAWAGVDRRTIYNWAHPQQRTVYSHRPEHERLRPPDADDGKSSHSSNLAPGPASPGPASPGPASLGTPSRPAVPHQNRSFVSRAPVVPVAQSQERFAGFGELLEAVLADRPSTMVEETPEDRLETARAQAHAASAWFSELADGYAARLASLQSAAARR